MHSTVCTVIDLFMCVCHILLINYYYYYYCTTNWRDPCYRRHWTDSVFFWTLSCLIRN